jgi:PAS domain S-box-containing protein
MSNSSEDANVPWKRVVEEMPAMLDAFDDQGRIVFWNRECERVTGYHANEIMSIAEPFRLLHPDSEYHDYGWTEWLQRGDEFRDWEWKTRCKDGSQRVISWSNLTRRLSVPGWKIWAVGVDVTERHRLLAALHESESRFRLLADHAPVMIWITDSQASTSYINRQWCAFTGTSMEANLGLGWIASVHPDDRERVAREFIDANARRDSVRLEYRLRRHDGVYRHVLDTAAPRYDDAGAFQGYVGSVIDLTDYLLAQEQQREVQRLDSLGVLAGGIAHEFNNLLTVILGYAHLAAAECLPGSSLHQHLAQVEQAARRGGDLCQKMLAYAGKSMSHLVEVDLERFLVDLRESLLSATPARFEPQLTTLGGLPTIAADPNLLQQVVLQLVANAAESYGENPGPIAIQTDLLDADETVLATYSLGMGLTPGPYVRLRIIDKGCGMDDAIRSRAFEPFFTTKFQGRGLGLSAALGIVRIHGGAIRLDSTPGQGTTVSILFPPCDSRRT